MSTLKKVFFAIALVAISAVSANALEAKIVVVDVQRIMRDSSAAKDLKAQLESKKNQFQAELKAKSDKLKKEKDDLDKQQNVLAKDALAAKQKSFLNEYKALQDDANQKTVTFENAEKNASREILSATQDIINGLAKEKDFNIAVPTSQLLFAHKDFDISDEVLKRLDAKLPKVTLKFDK